MEKFLYTQWLAPKAHGGMHEKLCRFRFTLFSCEHY